MTYEEFIDKFRPLKTPWPTFMEIDEGVTIGWTTTSISQIPEEHNDVRNRWSIIEVECDEDPLVIVPGVHVVNVMGYIVTEEQWSEEDLDLEIIP
jgi:hypothetical protein